MPQLRRLTTADSPRPGRSHPSRTAPRWTRAGPPGLLGRVSWPNLLTLSRLPLLFVVAAALQAGGPAGHLAAAVAAAVAAVSDFLDGYLARRWRQTTAFGAWMDALMDKIYTFGGFTALLATGHLAAWALLPALAIMARETAITGLRLAAAFQGRVLASEPTGKWKTALQLVAIALLCAAPALADSAAGGAATLCREAGHWLFAAAALLTIVSGGTYAWKHRSVLPNP